MFDDALAHIIASGLEVATGVAVVCFIYSICRDVRNAFLR